VKLEEELSVEGSTDVNADLKDWENSILFSHTTGIS
jgi:hypothetical protein